jgi:hypothetical protein
MNKFLALMFIGFALVSVVSVSGCTNPFVDPCQTEFEQCNYNCGEGIVSGICKEGCTMQFNQCKINS